MPHRQNKYMKKWCLSHFAIIFSAMVVSTSSVYAIPATLGASCGLQTPADTTGSGIFYPDGSVDAVLGYNNPGLAAGASGHFCIFPSLPTTADLDTACVTQGETDNQTNYAVLISPGLTEYCLYQYDINTVAADVRINGAVAAVATNPAAVPVFTPLGLLVTMFGLMWFGKRRKKAH